MHSISSSRDIRTLVIFATVMVSITVPVNGDSGVDSVSVVDRGCMTLQTDRVVIFKDGFSLFIKNGSGTADAAGNVFTEQVPEGAVLGTFWATSSQGETLAMKAQWVEHREERTIETSCISMLELLRSNQGKQVVLHLSREVEPMVSGTLVEVLDIPAQPLAINNELNGEMIREIVPHGGKLVVLDTDEHGREVFEVGAVRTISGSDLDTRIVRREEVITRKKRLSFSFGKEAANKPVTINLLYFSEGIRWIPTYRLAGELEDTGELNLQAEIINEAENIKHSVVDLIVGVPNFRFKSVVSPLSLERTLRHALAAAAPNLMGQRSSAMFNQRSGERRSTQHQLTPTGSDNMMQLAPELAASGTNDLFVYSVGDVSIPKGARMTVPVWQSDVPLRHIFTFDIDPVRNKLNGLSSRVASQTSSPLTLVEYQVWHQLELTNKSNVPWTTGPALLLRDKIPLGQELMTYTPVGGTSQLPVTVAVDVSGRYAEQEIERIPDSQKRNGYSYSLLRKMGTVTISNYRDKPADMHIKLGIGGRALTASGDGEIRVNDYRREDWANGGYGAVNNHSDISWNLTLEPGETRTLACEFSFYVR